jgi:hypothetical protein
MPSANKSGIGGHECGESTESVAGVLDSVMKQAKRNIGVGLADTPIGEPRPAWMPSIDAA